MEVFKKYTKDGGYESVIKKGNTLPSDAVNLGWYSTDDVTPENFLSILDTSSLIPENGGQLKAVNDDFTMYADEFGVLRYLNNNSELHQVKHSPIVKNSEVSVTNLILNKDNSFNGYNFTNLNQFQELKFAHSVYVSRYFTLINRSSGNLHGNRNFSSCRGSR